MKDCNMLKFLSCVTCFLQLFIITQCEFVGDKCLADGVSGTCKLISDCPALFNEVQSGGTPLSSQTRQKLNRLSCGFENDQPILCCKDGDTLNNKNGEAATNRNELDITGHKNFKLLPRNCGSPKTDRITGGSKTKFYEMPWMILLEYNTPRGLRLSCGGTIINEWYILTAAHCVVNLGQLSLASVLLGEYDTKKDPDCEKVGKESICAPKVQKVSINEVIPHPSYSQQTFSDDIALIRLSQPADFTLYTQQPICLPTTPDLRRDLLAGRIAVAAGWGSTEDGVQSSVLLKVDLPITSNEVCKKSLRREISDKQLCAGGSDGKDSCAGDSGGPLMDSVNDRQVQIGIVSYGPKRCGTVGLPGVYTKVANYVTWILDNIRE